MKIADRLARLFIMQALMLVPQISLPSAELQEIAKKTEREDSKYTSQGRLREVSLNPSLK